MSNDLLGLFLSNNFYVKNKHLIALDFFEDESKKIWRSIELGHNKYERDLTPLEVEQILFDEFSTMTTSQVHSMKTLTRSLPKDIGEDIASDVLMSQFKKYFGKLPNEIYDTFNSTSVNAASIGQVHLAEKMGRNLL